MYDVSANGANIPALGFGTFRIPEDDVRRILPEALKLGFRHVDTAQIYKNEGAVGEVIAQSGISRHDIFLTTKVWVDRFRHDDFLASVDESLKKLKTDHVDLLLLHWPNEAVSLAEQIDALNAVRKAGKTRHIGISNFNTALMAEAIRLSAAPLVTNQVEYHPYLDQTKVLEACARHQMAVVAYSPVAKGRLKNDRALEQIGARYGKTAAQVSLRWLVQQNVAVIPRTSRIERLSENLDIFDFELSDDEMRRIFAMGSAKGRLTDFGFAPKWD